MIVIEQIGLMVVTGLIIFFLAGIWGLKENDDSIIPDNATNWLVGVIIAIILIFTIIWAIFVDFYNKPEDFGYEKITIAEEVD